MILAQYTALTDFLPLEVSEQILEVSVFALIALDSTFIV